jgi:polysaccharide pyruvyl transferase WcaK-like protein
MNVPVLAIAHHPKVATLMDDFELSKYYLDIRNLDVWLTSRRSKRVYSGKELALQFDHLFPSTQTSIGAHHRGIETNGRQ